MKMNYRIAVVLLVLALASLACLTTTPHQSGDVLFSDDFSRTNSGWDKYSDSRFLTDYLDGTYRIQVNDTSSYAWANPGNRSFTDVRIEVDATKAGGPDDNDFGVICRTKDINHFYFGIITSDGYYGIIKMNGENSSLLGRDNLETSSLINQGAATNHIRFDCIGSTLTLYVNGTQIDQQTDGEYTEGNVGLIAGTYDVSGTDIRFDNFFVYQP
jgi:hypothetical protein